MCLGEPIEPILIDVNHFIHDHRLSFGLRVTLLAVILEQLLVLLKLLKETLTFPWPKRPHI